MIIIPKNTDIKLNLTLKMNNVAVNLNTLTGLGVWITYSNGALFLKFSKNATSIDNNFMTGFKKIKYLNAEQGKFQIIIDAQDTINANTGILNLDTKIQFTDNDVLTGIFHKAAEQVTGFAQIKENVMQATTNL